MINRVNLREIKTKWSILNETIAVKVAIGQIHDLSLLAQNVWKVSCLYHKVHTPPFFDLCRSTIHQTWIRTPVWAEYLHQIGKCTPCTEPGQLTKTHKPDLSIKPIVSSVNSATESLSSFTTSWSVWPPIWERHHTIYQGNHKHRHTTDRHTGHNRCEIFIHLHPQQGWSNNFKRTLASKLPLSDARIDIVRYKANWYAPIKCIVWLRGEHTSPESRQTVLPNMWCTSCNAANVGNIM